MVPPPARWSRPSPGRTTLLVTAALASLLAVVRWPAEEAPAGRLAAAGPRASDVPAELQPLAWSQGALQTAKARPGGVNDYVTVCSVAHIGGGYAITAGHCLDPCRSCAVTEDKAVENGGLFVDWDSGAVDGTGWATVDRIAWSLWDEATDFALIHVKGPFPRVALPLDLDVPVELGAPLTLFSHPHGLPLRWSGACIAVSGQDYVPSEAASYLAHTCEIEEGSSGAALIRLDSREAVAIVTGMSTHLVEAPGHVSPERVPKGSYAFRLEQLPERVKGLLVNLPGGASTAPVPLQP